MNGTHVSWHLNGGLAAATIERMHAAAVAILGRTGMAVHHAGIRSGLLQRDGFAEHAGRILIEPRRVDDWLDDMRRRHPGPLTPPAGPTSPDRVRYTLLDYNSWIVTDDGRGLRPLTRADAVAGTKLAEVLKARGVIPSVPGVPQDVPATLVPLEQYLIGAEYSSAGGSSPLVADIQTATVIRELNRACGRETLSAPVWLPNPLGFGGPNVDVLWHFRSEITHASVGSMPVMGVSGPCDPIALMTLCLAEVIGGATILHAVLPGLDVGIFTHPQPGDMRSGTLMLGPPEGEILDLLKRAVLHWYGVGWNAKPVQTSASLPGPQAQLERTTGALLGALAGCDQFHGVGTLGIDEVWSPAQLLLDLDSVGHAVRVARGAESAPGLELEHLPDVIDAVVRSGLPFMAHETTAANFRQQYHLPELLRRQDRAQWVAAGKPDVFVAAAERAQQLIGQHAYEPPAGLMQELRAIYERGKAVLGGPARC
jgi:trimethylamine--corrinoid protein Co-methyltransferase